MESGLQELKFSRYNQKVELSGKLFLYNALTGGYASNTYWLFTEYYQ